MREKYIAYISSFFLLFIYLVYQIIWYWRFIRLKGEVIITYDEK